MSDSRKGSKSDKCFRFVEVDGKVSHRYEDRGTNPHKGSAWTKRLLNKASRRGSKRLIETEAA